MPDAFSRERMLLGEAAVQRLRESHVIVFGLGGPDDGAYVHYR